jgi:two-component system sensor histidine kinase SenX3
LSIVRHVAVNHSGSVRVESREGEGSTFTLRLPARSLAAPAVAGWPSSAHQPPRGGRTGA